MKLNFLDRHSKTSVFEGWLDDPYLLIPVGSYRSPNFSSGNKTGIFISKNLIV